MIALHLSVHDGQPYFWIEQGRRTTLDAAGKEIVLRQHGFPTAMKPLAEALDEMLAGTETARRDCMKCTAWLPAAGRAVLPSSPLLGSRTPTSGASTLLPVSVIARRMQLEEFTAFREQSENDRHGSRAVMPAEQTKREKIILTNSRSIRILRP
jgi:hypothetical protein